MYHQILYICQLHCYHVIPSNRLFICASLLEINMCITQAYCCDFSIVYSYEYVFLFHLRFFFLFIIYHFLIYQLDDRQDISFLFTLSHLQSIVQTFCVKKGEKFCVLNNFDCYFGMMSIVYTTFVLANMHTIRRTPSLCQGKLCFPCCMFIVLSLSQYNYVWMTLQYFVKLHILHVAFHVYVLLPVYRIHVVIKLELNCLEIQTCSME